MVKSTNYSKYSFECTSWINYQEMGTLVSKQTRRLAKDLPKTPGSKVNTGNNPLAKKLRDDYLNLKETDSGKEEFPKVYKEEIKSQRIYTNRPKEDEEVGDVTKSDFFQKAVKLGIVNVKEVKTKSTSGAYDKNNETLRLLKNRKKIESEYEDLLVSQQKIEYDIPKRFLNKEQLKKVNKTRKKAKNNFGLIDGRSLEKLVKAYKIEGQEKMNNLAQKSDTKKENVELLEHMLQNGLINLPTSRITLVRKLNGEGQVINEKLVVIPDDWVNEGQRKLKQKKMHAEHKQSSSGTVVNHDSGKPSDEILGEFKKLENLIKVNPHPEVDHKPHEKPQGRKSMNANQEVKRYI